MGFTGLTEEVKYEYEPLVLPEGYRFLRNHIDDEGHWALITDAPDPTPDLRLSYDIGCCAGRYRDQPWRSAATAV